jgi:hypothetical protein
VIEQRAADVGNGRVVQIMPQIDAVDLGAQRTGNGQYLELHDGRHRVSPVPADRRRLTL